MANFNKQISLGLILFTALFSCGPLAYAKDETFPKNVRIDVEFKEYRETKQGILSATWQEGKRSEYTKQFIVVSDGLSASIFVGQQVPYETLTYYRNYLHGGGYVEGNVTIKEVGTKLRVEPKIIGDAVAITLTPQISFISDKKKGTIDIKTLTTTVIVQNGRSVSIGGLLQDADFERYFLTSSSKSNLDIILTPHIQ